MQLWKLTKEIITNQDGNNLLFTLFTAPAIKIPKSLFREKAWEARSQGKKGEANK